MLNSFVVDCMVRHSLHVVSLVLRPIDSRHAAVVDGMKQKIIKAHSLLSRSNVLLFINCTHQIIARYFEFLTEFFESVAFCARWIRIFGDFREQACRFVDAQLTNVNM